MRPVVSYAADLAGVDETTPYHHRDHHPEFAAQWEIALAKGIQRGESEAWRRAVEGCLKPVFQGGHEVGKIREFSDQLLMFMLRAHRPEVYRERLDITVIRREAEKLARAVGLDESDVAEVIAIAERLQRGAQRTDPSAGSLA